MSFFSLQEKHEIDAAMKELGFYLLEEGVGSILHWMEYRTLGASKKPIYIIFFKGRDDKEVTILNRQTRQMVTIRTITASNIKRWVNRLLKKSHQVYPGRAKKSRKRRRKMRTKRR